MSHLVRLDFGISELVAHGRVDGWLPRFYLGYQEFLFNGPGLAWAVALLRGLTLGALSNAGALKVAGVLSLAAMPAAVAFAARSLRLGRRSAGIAAVLALLVSNVFGVGLQGVYVVGLVPHQMGAACFFVALGALIRMLSDNRSRWVVIAALALAALAVTHLISAMILALVFPLLAVAGLVRRWPGPMVFVRLAATGALAAALAGWWLLPFLAHSELRGVVATWSTPPFGDRVDQIVDGRLVLRPYTFWLVAAGWAYAVARVRRHRPFALALVVVPPLYLVGAHWLVSRWPANEIALQLSNRGVGYVTILAVLPFAAAVAGASRAVAWAAPDRAALADVAAVVVAAAIVLSPLGPDRAVATELPEAISPLDGAAVVLRETVPDGARFATQHDYPSEITRTNVLHPDIWLAQHSGRNSLNGFNLESSNTFEANFEYTRLTTQAPEQSADALVRLGVTHVVTTEPVLAAALAASDRFREEWAQEPVTIFEVRAAPGQPAPASLLSTDGQASARLVRAEPERIAIDATADAATEATVAVAWSPKWHGEIDGKPVDLRRTGDGLIALSLPAGRSVVTLTYEPDVWDRLGAGLTLLTVVGLGAVLLARRRLRRQPAPD